MLDENETILDNSKVGERLKEDLQYYRKTLLFLGGNVPIEALCLPKVIETLLIKDGLTRVYDLIGRDLTEIKGIGKTRVDLLASRLDEFFSVGL